jgi:hypothetical protein
MASAELIPFAFYQKLSPRERTLVLAVAGTVFVLANLFAVSTLAGTFDELRHACAEQSSDLEAQRVFASEQPKLAKRMAWLRTTQPVLTSRDVAGASLLRQIEQFARGSAVIVTNPQIKPLPPASAESRSTSADYQAVTVEIETQSNWAGLVKFVGGLQQPSNFLVFDLATVRSDTDPAVIRGHFQISKWYAPAH